MAKKAINRELCSRFAKARAFYAPSKAKFVKMFGLNSPSILSDIERGAREPSHSLLNKIIAKGDISPQWLLEGEGEMLEPKHVVQEQAPIYRPAMRPSNWRAAVERVDAALVARGLARHATEQQKDLLVALLAQGEAAGTAPEELQRQLDQLVDLIDTSIRRARGGTLPSP
jgi:hypothetical protein